MSEYECSLSCGYRTNRAPAEEKCNSCGWTGTDAREFCPSCGEQDFGHACPRCGWDLVCDHPDTYGPFQAEHRIAS